MASGPDPAHLAEVCTIAGRDLARDGASLDEALEALRTAYDATVGADPDFDAVRATCLGWSETTLAFFHKLSCEDPMTGLSSLSHLRSRLSELYRSQFREATSARDTHALVVADMPLREPASRAGESTPIAHALRVSAMGDSARTVFAGEETIGRLGAARIGILARRDERLGRRVALLRRMLGELGPDGVESRVWIEGLPATDQSCAGLLDELARS